MCDKKRVKKAEVKMSESKEQLRAQMAEFEMTVSNVLERRNSWYSDIPLTSPASTIAQSPLDIKSPSPKPLSSVQVIIMAIRTLTLKIDFTVYTLRPALKSNLFKVLRLKQLS